jgi:hypothetical protein
VLCTSPVVTVLLILMRRNAISNQRPAQARMLGSRSSLSNIAGTCLNRKRPAPRAAQRPGAGRGRGFGRGLGVGVALGVEVGVGVKVGVGVGVGAGTVKAYTLLSPAM